MNRIIVEDIEEIISEKLPYEKMYGKTVLISGANGYVPAYFVHSFIGMNDKFNAGIKVIALCRNHERASERFADYLGRDDFELLIQDVCDQIKTDKRINIFIHAASPAGIKTRHDNPVNTFLANVKGVENMLELAVKNPCEYFLFISSVDVYGRMDSNKRLKEGDFGYLNTLDVRNSYSNGKRAAESLCKAFQVKYKLPIYIVRPFQIIGPGPQLNDGRLHIDFISQILEKKQIILKSDGSAIRSFMYITDAVKAMLFVMLLGNVGEAYNIVCEQGEMSVKNLADTMARNVIDTNIEVLFDYEKRNTIEVTSALSVVIGDSSRLSELGWKCKHSVKEGTKRMMDYYGIKVRK